MRDRCFCLLGWLIGFATFAFCVPFAMAADDDAFFLDVTLADDDGLFACEDVSGCSCEHECGVFVATEG